MKKRFLLFPNRLLRIRQPGARELLPPLSLPAYWLAAFFLSAGLLNRNEAGAQPLNTKSFFTHQDTLRGSNTPERAWWDVLHYSLAVFPDIASKSIKGSNNIRYKVISHSHPNLLQIDLQPPMTMDSVFYDGQKLAGSSWQSIRRYGNVWYVPVPAASRNSQHQLNIFYSGRPRQAVTPPWDGGWIWTEDKMGRPWISVACQGLGASVWYPCKDIQSDEPDEGASLSVTVPDSLMAIANGRLKNKSAAGGQTTYTWEVSSPINTYNLVPYIGKYTGWTENFKGEKGNLDCSYWALDYDLPKAKKQFAQVPLMLKAFEYWFGPYPFYADGYKLVEAPHLGMEHQSAIAYGNEFENGYLGKDLSGTGWGLKWDYIIVHESGHEWFGNNITSRDIADMWVHEGFTDYSETLFTEFYYGKKAADAYVQGLRRYILNDRPVTGPYGVNKEGSEDMYYKGANLVHTIRQIIGNDDQFRRILRGLNQTFYHQSVNAAQVEEYINRESGRNFSKVFEQYLTTTLVPELQLKKTGAGLQYKWNNCVSGFDMPVRMADGRWLQPTTSWQTLKEPDSPATVQADPNFYIRVKVL